MKEDTQKGLKGQKIFVGMDTHNKTWKISIYYEDSYYKTFTLPPDPIKLYTYLQKHFPDCEYHVVYEAGFCGFWIYRELTQMGIICMVAHPGDVATTDKERRRKSDPRDANKLARELRNGSLDCINIPDKQREEDRQIIRQGKTITKEITRTKNRIKSYLAFKGILIPECLKKRHWSKIFIQWLMDLAQSNDILSTYLEILTFFKGVQLETNKRLYRLSREERYKANVTLLRSISGIGPKSAITWLTEIGDIREYKNLDRLNSYIGFIPSTHSSGEKERYGKMEHRGNKLLRSTLIECAWIAIRVDYNLHEAYRRYRQTMSEQKAIVRIAKKLVSRIHFVLVNQQAYVSQ